MFSLVGDQVSLPGHMCDLVTYDHHSCCSEWSWFPELERWQEVSKLAGLHLSAFLWEDLNFCVLYLCVSSDHFLKCIVNELNWTEPIKVSRSLHQKSNVEIFAACCWRVFNKMESFIKLSAWWTLCASHSGHMHCRSRTSRNPKRWRHENDQKGR